MVLDTLGNSVLGKGLQIRMVLSDSGRQAVQLLDEPRLLL
jgi:hypothetical protein